MDIASVASVTASNWKGCTITLCTDRVDLASVVDGFSGAMMPFGARLVSDNMTAFAA